MSTYFNECAREKPDYLLSLRAKWYYHEAKQSFSNDEIASTCCALHNPPRNDVAYVITNAILFINQYTQFQF